MTRFIHDQFAKQYLQEILSTRGEVETSRDMAGEMRQVDVFFVPFSQPPENPTPLGFLEQIITKKRRELESRVTKRARMKSERVTKGTVSLG